VGSVAEKAGLRYFGLDGKAEPRMFYRRAVEGPVQCTEMARGAIYGSLEEQSDESWQHFSALGLPGEILRGDENGTPSDSTACLFDDMA
jgi:hypothetical protein